MLTYTRLGRGTEGENETKENGVRSFSKFKKKLAPYPTYFPVVVENSISKYFLWLKTLIAIYIIGKIRKDTISSSE